MFLRNPNNQTGMAAAVAISWAALMISVLNRYPFPHVFPQDVDSPVLALEMSRNASDIDAVLHRSEPDNAPRAAYIMWLGNVLDLVFIPICGFFLWSLARLFTAHTRLLTSLIAGAALFDYVEDWQIFRALNGLSPAIYVSSLIKWGLLGLVFLFTAVILLRSVSPVYSTATKRLIAIAYLVSGGLIVLSVSLGEFIGYSHIELAMRIFGLVVIVHLIGMFGHYLSIPGISQKYVENFCEERRRAGKESMTAVKPERAK